MRNKNIDEFDLFATFLSSDGEITSSQESLRRLDDVISMQLERANKAAKKAWISRAPAERGKFEGKINGLMEKLVNRFGSREELFNAVKNGVFGGPALQRLQLQFRNRKVDELSDSDLMSIVGDQEILKLLKQEDHDKEK